MFNKDFNSLLEVIQEFSTEEKCIAHLEELYWQGVPVSPFAPEAKVYKSKKPFHYVCSVTKKKFTVLHGTMFHGTKIPLVKWFCAIYLILNHKKGISSVQLAKDLGGISQKSAWHLLHRVRACLGIEDDDKFEGICEADETFVGGKNKNRHKDKKVAQSQGRSFKDKTPIVGILKRGESKIITRPHKQIPHITVQEKVITSYSQVRTKVIPDTKKASVQPFIKDKVAKDSVLISDEWHAYKGLESTYGHHVVDHGKKQYVDYDNPEIHSNSIESYWGILKRGYNGIYNWWSPKHMQKYADEFSFRFNNRGIQSGERFNLLLLSSTVRTKYKDLTKCLD